MASNGERVKQAQEKAMVFFVTMMWEMAQRTLNGLTV